MADFSNIITGLNIPSQIPLNVKEFIKDEATLSSLGVGDNLAYTYHEYLKVLCISEKTLWEWREVQTGEENTGLISVDFIYPLNLPETYNINYSGKRFNFFQIIYITSENINDYVSGIEGPTGPQGEAGPAGIQGLPGDDGTTFVENGVSTIVNGDGTSNDPYKIEIQNLQKTISTFPYTVTSLDDKYTIFVNNGTNDIVINIPNGLINNFSCVFIQEGTGEVTISASGTANILKPVTLQNVIKGQYFWAIIEKRESSNTYYLLGSLKIV